MTAVLVLNGTPPSTTRLRELATQYPVYAADGGGKICAAASVKPQWVVGDFDSVSPRELPEEWTCRRIPDQDSTDFEKLLFSLPPEIDDLLILAAFGDRLDHLLTNLLIVSALPPRMRVRLEGEGQSLVRVSCAHAFEQDLPPASTLSLLPFPSARGVSTRGLRWNLEEATLAADQQLGQSNQVVGPVHVRLREGCLFVWTRSPHSCAI
jgi:thiamine pyrophosphokinase